jgi:hypothetical protein
VVYYYAQNVFQRSLATKIFQTVAFQVGLYEDDIRLFFVSSFWKMVCLSLAANGQGLLAGLEFIARLPGTAAD